MDPGNRVYTDTLAMDGGRQTTLPISQSEINYLSPRADAEDHEASPSEILEKGALFDHRPLSTTSSSVSSTLSSLGGDSFSGPTLPDLWVHPCLTIHASEVLSNVNNFASVSDVDVLTVTGAGSRATFARNCRDVDVEEAIKASLDLGVNEAQKTWKTNDPLTQLQSLKGTPQDPAIMIMCVKLDANQNATFEQQSSISKSLAGKVFSHFDVHGGFLLDLVGRPNYWSATSQVKTDAHGEVFEFFCQHPRWHQKGRYDKQKQGATQGNKAPCSLYMTYSVASNTTFYLVVAPDDGVWFSFLDRIQTGDKDGSGPFSSLLPPGDLARSPFQVHAMVASIAFEEATNYAATLRELLMAQLKQVNDYSDSQGQAQGDDAVQIGNASTRIKLHGITTQLHSVSQMINTGLGGVQSSIKLSKRLLEAHALFCERAGRGKPGSMVGRTHAIFRYVLDSFLYQEHWLAQYRSRKETAMNFVFNMVTQQDSSTNLQMSFNMSQDSSSMHAITILTMVFLPGTFTATLFSTVAFQSSDKGAIEVTDWLWPFVGVAVILTLTVVATWYFRRNMGRMTNAFLRRMERRKLRKTEADAGFMA